MKILAVVDGTEIAGVCDAPVIGDGFVGVQQIDERGAGRVNRPAVRQGLRGTGSVKNDEHLLRAEPARIGEEPGPAELSPLVDLRAERQRRIKPAEIIQPGDELKQRMRHVETVHAREAGILELAGKHVLAVVGVGGAVERLLGAVIEAGNAARGVEKRQRDGQAGCVVLEFKKRG